MSHHSPVHRRFLGKRGGTSELLEFRVSFEGLSKKIYQPAYAFFLGFVVACPASATSFIAFLLCSVLLHDPRDCRPDLMSGQYGNFIDYTPLSSKI